MPTRPPSRCTDPGCAAFATRRGRCDDHQPIPWAGRDNKAARYGISSGRWRTLKRHTGRRDHDTCHRCGTTEAELLRADPDAEPLELDHITPIGEGGAAEDPANLGLICAPCHEIKSKQEAARANARRRGGRGRR
ncbi:HNH endonuclease [Streptomyces uncialis]|uniref:HNH endonuclease n=1 Tax=Streptomyces uncialis TaxID=1048205 RepID=UPI002250BF1C|nr:HNH endonuclease [Streptomyces uncialis]MCX4661488.1 HNH endonuclease [Streptomyces uncialis]